LSRGPDCFDMPAPASLADDQGRFTMPELPDGYEPGRLVPLSVQTSDGQSFETSYLPAFQTKTVDDVEVFEGKMVDVYLPTHMHPRAAAPRDVADDELAGVVVDARGQAIEGVEVALYEAVPPGVVTNTDGEGRFSIKNVGGQTRGRVGHHVGPVPQAGICALAFYEPADRPAGLGGGTVGHDVV
jgi:hypothetical protein